MERTGPISVLYEEKPWLSAFRVEGIRPRKSRGRDYTRQMQLILQYTRAFGKITRKNVTELAKLSPSLATSLLRRIVEGGYLERCSKGAGTYYVLTEEGKKYR